MERAIQRENTIHNNGSTGHVPPYQSHLYTINDEWETLCPERSLCSPNSIDSEYQHLNKSEIHDGNDNHVQRLCISRKNQDKERQYQKRGKDVCFKNERLLEIRYKKCTICHVNIRDMSIKSTAESQIEPEFTCPQGHSLCNQCVQQFGLRTDMDCIFCGINRHYLSDKFPEEQNIEGIRRVETRQQQQLPSLNSDDISPNFGCPDESVVIKRNNTFSNLEQNGLSENNPNKTENLEQNHTDSYNKQCRQQNCYMTKNTLKQTTSDEKINMTNQFLSEYSRRPIHCPRVDCAMNVAFSALTHHFLFDHPEVPILCVDPGIRSTLIVSLTALTCDISRCLALLLVSGKLTDPAAWMFNGNHINEKYRNRLPLSVLAARVSHNGCYVLPCDVHASGEYECKKEIVIIWIAGLDIGNTGSILRCSIQATDNIGNNGFRSMTYTGPISSLRTTQHPREVFLNGDCIILHEGLIDRITSGCASLSIHIIVH